MRFALQTRTRSTSSGLRPRLRNERGGTLVETAFSIAILLTLVVGIIEVCWAVYSYHFISNAAREGVRYAIVRGNTWTQAPWNYPLKTTCGSYTDAACVASQQNIEDYVKSLAFPGINPANLTVTPSSYTAYGATSCPPPTDSSGKSDPTQAPTCNAQTDVIEVKVQYNFPYSIPFIPSTTLSMSSTASMVVSQ